MAEQAQALLLSEGTFVWFPMEYGKSLCYPLLHYKLGRIYARTNAALVDRRGLGSRV